MTTIYFTKEFTSGLMKNLRYNESMRFTSLEAAVEFMEKCRKPTKNAIGGSNWFVADYSFQKHWGLS